MHQINLGGLLGSVSTPLLLIIPCWVLTDLNGRLRLLALAAAVVYRCSISVNIFRDHIWFNPADDPPIWQELIRGIAGPFACGLVALIALPAPWEAPERLAVWVLIATPITIHVRIADHDTLLSAIVPLVEEEAHEGRNLVLSETHGALSTHLRMLEQHTRRLRASEPALYELAVSANSRLRETLTLRDQDPLTSTTVDTLEMSEHDRDLTRLVLNDLVGNALHAGATAISAVVRSIGARIMIDIVDDAPPMAPGVWQAPGTSSSRLTLRLAQQDGELSVVQAGCTRRSLQPGSPAHEGKTMTERGVLLVDDVPGERLNFQAAFATALTAVRSVGDLNLRLQEGHEWDVAFVDFNLSSPSSTGLSALLRLSHERPETRIVTYSQFNEGGRTLFAAAAKHWFGANALMDKIRNEPAALTFYVQDLCNDKDPTPLPWQQRLASAPLIDSLLAEPSWVRIWQAIREASGEMAVVAKILDVEVAGLRGFKDRATEAAIAFNEKFHDQPHPGYSRNKKGILSSFAAEHRHFLTAPDLSTVMSPGTRRRR